ncbi:hypothetical protein LPC09_23085 [Metabacillus sp. B2-18]|nr:hypothetical protein [Metabacillus sp. B2-18]UGB30546.1 hypothetical protein LPC09_23085 [Metabacillus sp. B2-18]
MEIKLDSASFLEDSIAAILFKFTVNAVNFACKAMFFDRTLWQDLAHLNSTSRHFPTLGMLFSCIPF